MSSNAKNHQCQNQIENLQLQNTWPSIHHSRQSSPQPNMTEIINNQNKNEYISRRRLLSAGFNFNEQKSMFKANSRLYN